MPWELNEIICAKLILQHTWYAHNRCDVSIMMLVIAMYLCLNKHYDINLNSFLFFNLNIYLFIYFNWRLITLQYCSGFCHTLTWISHGCTCVLHPEPSSRLPPHPIPQGHPSAPALSTLSHASNLDWRSVSHMIIFMFQCHSLKSSHLRLLPQSPKDCSIPLCFFCCLTYRFIVTIFLNSIYMHYYTVLVFFFLIYFTLYNRLQFHYSLRKKEEQEKKVQPSALHGRCCVHMY